MSIKYLGEHFDIHCGGVDNIFPLHENELAQSVSATNKPFVNYWMHSEHLQLKGGKMSKTEGNFYTISECRDLCFHAKEHQFTLNDIEDMLKRYELNFLGFIVLPQIKSLY